MSFKSKRKLGVRSRFDFVCLKYFHIIYYLHYDNATAPLGSWYLNSYWQSCIRRIFNNKGLLDTKYKSALVCFIAAPRSPAFSPFSMMQHRCLEGWNISHKGLLSVNYCSYVLFFGKIASISESKRFVGDNDITLLSNSIFKQPL